MTTADDMALLTDLYELTMAQSYFEHDMFESATFSLFVRTYPRDRSYFVAAGLEDVLRYLDGLSFSPDAIEYLASTRIFSRSFLDHLGGLRFTGDVHAIPEGRLFFPEEPIIEVTAPIIEAQIAESFIINQINLQSLIASKAARCVSAAPDKNLVDFSLRRTHGIDAGLKVARSSYVVGFSSTSNVLAGKQYGIPISGTMAHSYVSAFEHESESFRSFAESFPERSILLIDTYDTLDGARKAAQVAKEMEMRGQRLVGVRLDSGDLASLSRDVRRILDEESLQYVQIIASGGLDEHDIEELVEASTPIDGFGIGTKMGVSGDAPWLDMAYKLVRYGGRPVLKLSQEKASLPGVKQVYRIHDNADMLQRDVIALRDEALSDGEPILVPVMRGGQPLDPYPSLEEIRARFQGDFARLPAVYKLLRDAPRYPVGVSAGLTRLFHEVQEEVEVVSRRELGES